MSLGASNGSARGRLLNLTHSVHRKGRVERALGTTLDVGYNVAYNVEQEPPVVNSEIRESRNH